MEKQDLLWRMTSQQFAAFDTQLYLDTHPYDAAAVQMFNKFQNAHAELQRQYESIYGPLGADKAASPHWDWVSDPWPWEREAN